jgi:hypothetical protein
MNMNALMNFLDLANYPIPEPVRIGIFVALLTGLALLVLDTVIQHRRQLKRKAEILRWQSALDASRQRDRREDEVFRNCKLNGCVWLPPCASIMHCSLLEDPGAVSRRCDEDVQGEWEMRSSPQAIEAMEIRLSQNDYDD